MNSTETNSAAFRILREDIEWCDIWLPDSNKHDLPRCLLIGDSITMGYYPVVAKAMAGQAYVGRFATSKSIGDSYFIQELKLVLNQAKFDIVHFNNGMHGWDYTEAEFERDFPVALAAIGEALPTAKLIWANITPVRVANDLEKFDDRTERVKKRNAIAARFATEAGLPINDLFSLGQNSKLFSADGVHFTSSGSAVLAQQVVEHLQRK